MSKTFTKKDVLMYLDKIYKKTQDQRLNDEKVRSQILSKINEACQITNLSFSNILQRLDFKPNDLTIEALESFLAELRSIFWLQDFGFTNIVPLQAKKNSQQPDFTAKHQDKTCAVEVFCLTQAHEQQRDSALNVYVNFDPQFEGSKFGRDFMSKAGQKKTQLDFSNADIRVLLCVINSSPAVALNAEADMNKHAKFLREKLGWGVGYYIGVLAGEDSAIYPKLDS
ncbi:MAG: hypothetical protein U1A25_02040 [Candidatus Sungbacteria bacterium]|nr:hypothetical protein [bacterium]MDZ4260421.1 hypothetical protein [Candidatus Sungbacteria bacterium]